MVRMTRLTIKDMIRILNSGGGCGTGAGGFQPGNTCARGGGGERSSPKDSMVTADGKLQPNGPSPKGVTEALGRMMAGEKSAIALWAESSGNVKMGIYPEWQTSGLESMEVDPKVTARNFLSALGKIPDYEGMVYRGVGEEGAERLLNLKKGGTYDDKLGPNSATRFPRMALTAAGGTVVLRIKTKTGKSIEQLPGVSAEEGEVVTTATKYKVTGRRSVKFSATGLPEGFLKKRLDAKKFTVIDLEEIS